MSDLATLKEDLNSMKHYRRWVKAVANNAEKELSVEWSVPFKTILDSALDRLDRLVRQCTIYIETGEGVYEENEE